MGHTTFCLYSLLICKSLCISFTFEWCVCDEVGHNGQKKTETVELYLLRLTHFGSIGSSSGTLVFDYGGVFTGAESGSHPVWWKTCLCSVSGITWRLRLYFWSVVSFRGQLTRLNCWCSVSSCELWNWFKTRSCFCFSLSVFCTEFLHEFSLSMY